MENQFDQALEVDVLAAALRQNNQESGDLLEFLSQKLEQSLPSNTTVTRTGWLLSKDRPVQKIVVEFEDYHYQISRQKNGTLSASVVKLGRGIVLKTTTISVEQWINEIAQEIVRFAQNSEQTRKALNRFVLGEF